MSKQLRIWLFVLLGTLLTSTSLLAEGVITMTTSKSIGDYICLIIKANGSVSISGVEESARTDGSNEYYTLTSQTITIRGDVTYLDCSYVDSRLTSLDVSGCTSLTSLYCSSNQLTSLDVSSCTALTNLSCFSNQLTSLNVSGCTALTELDCWGNQLTSLNVSGCTALTKLDCYGNKLTSWDLSDCTSLRWLDCRGNQLTSLDLSGCTALRWLDCKYNQLTSLDVSKNTALTELNCSKNPLTSVNLSGCQSLKEFSWTGGKLTSLNVSGCTALTTLICDHNQLTSLDVSGCSALTRLYCFNNQLTSLDVSSCTALTKLYCFDNQLTSLDVSKNTALTEFECSDNQIKGEEMTRLVNSLPDRTGKKAGKFTVVQEPALEGNICLKSDVAIAKGKNWNTLKYKSDTRKYVAYEGAHSLKVTLTKEGEGTLTATGADNLNAVPEGTELTIVATPADGYKLTALTANGKDILTTKKLSVREDTEIKATFAKKKNYTVTFTPEGEGKLTATRNGEPFTSGSTAREGDKIIFTAQPATGYKVDKWLLSEAEIELTPYTGLATFECTVGTADVLLKTTFVQQTFTVTLTSNEHGTISIVENVDLKAVPYGTTLTVQATGKNDQCELTALTANGEDILATKKFVVKGATEVKATFVDHTNIAEVNTEAIRFYPNPAREYIIVEGTLPATLVTLYSMEGMRLYEDETDAEGTLRIDLSAYAEGTYLLRIADQTHRIIVQH